MQNLDMTIADAVAEAIARGECAACRIAGTHAETPECAATPANRLMIRCINGHGPLLYDASARSGLDGCPVCEPQ